MLKLAKGCKFIFLDTSENSPEKLSGLAFAATYENKSLKIISPLSLESSDNLTYYSLYTLTVRF